MSGQSWDASYHHGPAPWDIGRPQQAIVRVASAGGFVGAVLGAGCGTGENTLHVAAIKPERVHTRFHGENGAPAWFATIKHI